MGMSASQARLLSLQARQSNLEYQGQQINQERTILSQQCTALYNSLLNMTVPTPPATTDYQTIQYSGTIGATNYTFDANSIKPYNTEKDTYTLTVGQKTTGSSLEAATGYVKSNNKSAGTITGSVIGSEATITAAEKNLIYVLDSITNSVRKATDDDFTPKGDKFVIKDSVLADGKQFIKKGTGGNTYNVVASATGKSVNGHELQELKDDLLNKYQEAIANSGLCNSDGKAYQPSDFYIYFDDNNNANFVLKNDVINNLNENGIKSYKYVANGAITKKTTYNDVKITFDPTNGRITEIAIPNYGTTKDDKDNDVVDYNNIVSWTSMDVEAETVTDENAYKDAYNKYEYDQYLYDQKNKEINAKTEVIQQEDKNLELKLQRLDNERTQITTEIEAVEKVINDNIEASYKTFSG